MILYLSITLLSVVLRGTNAALCGCDSCTEDVWNAIANDRDGNYACGERVNYLKTSLGYDEASACAKVSDEFPDGPCGPVCDPRTCNLPVTHCGCDSCTEDVWTSVATGPDGSYTCGGRISWLQSALGYDEASACAKVGDEFPDGSCGPACDPRTCNIPVTHCGCDSCTEDVWTSVATGPDGSYTCGGRINWLQSSLGYDEASACAKVSEEFPGGPCGPSCDPRKCVRSTSPSKSLSPTSYPSQLPPKVPTDKPTRAPTGTPSLRHRTHAPTAASSNASTMVPTTSNQMMCGCTSCTEDVLNLFADGHSCRGRIAWVIQNYGLSEVEACNLVGNEYPDVCGACHNGQCGEGESPESLKVASYNTEYSGYWDGRFDSFAWSINADIVGLQECQDASGIAAASGYSFLEASGNGNTILYKSDRIKELSSGRFNVPRDDYAQRNISWGKFQVTRGVGAGNEFWFFNTHLPHNHNEAADPNTHSIIANMLLNKRQELGAGNSPSVVTCDCNPFASAGAANGSFETNLASNGIDKVYEATGTTGGYAGLDKIFASQDHWSWISGADVGTGSSDHPAIVAELTFSSQA